MYRVVLSTLFVFGSFGTSLEALAAQNAVIQERSGALLQTEIFVVSGTSAKINPEKIEPGSHIRLTALVKNQGTLANEPGTMRIRYAFPKPMDHNPESVIFETETVAIPSIPPGATLALNFDKTHQWPSLFDYIRNNWGMRTYEAVAIIRGEEEIIGTRPIVFSAYYTPGESNDKPVRVSSADYHK